MQIFCFSFYLLERNQRCLNSLGQNGVCTSILACVGSNFVTQDDVDLLRRSPCDGGDRLVCCVNTANTQSRNSGVSNLFPDRSTCGIQVNIYFVCVSYNLVKLF